MNHDILDQAMIKGGILLIVGIVAGIIALLTIFAGGFNVFSFSYGVDRAGNSYHYDPMQLRQYGCIDKGDVLSKSYFLFSMPPDVLPADVHPYNTYYLRCIQGGMDQKLFVYSTSPLLTREDLVGAIEHNSSYDVVTILVQQDTYPIKGHTILFKNDKYTVVDQNGVLFMDSNDRPLSYMIEGGKGVDLLKVALSIK